MAVKDFEKAASKEELESFISQNKRWLPEDAEKVLRGLPAVDQRRVISAGTMSSVKNPAAVIQARVRKAREVEIQLGRPVGAASAAGGPADGALRGLSKPATKEELEGFIKANERWLQGEAAQILRAMIPEDQKRVIAAGTLSGCRDPVAVLQTRAKKAREMEMEVVNMGAVREARAPTPERQVLPQQQPVDEATAMMHILAPLEEVSRQESRFAPPPAKVVEDNSTIAGEDRGVGGVVEIVKAKYGCGKGQRLRVIGETNALLQFEGGKSAPRDHENKHWRWVLRQEEDAKLQVKRAAEEQVRMAEQAAKDKAAREAAKQLAEEEAALRRALQARAEKAQVQAAPVGGAWAPGLGQPPPPSKKRKAPSSSGSSSSASSDDDGKKKAKAEEEKKKKAEEEVAQKPPPPSSSSTSDSSDEEAKKPADAKKQATKTAAEAKGAKAGRSSSSDSSSSTKVDVRTGRRRKDLDKDKGEEKEAAKTKKSEGPAAKGKSLPVKKGKSSSSSSSSAKKSKKRQPPPPSSSSSS